MIFLLTACASTSVFRPYTNQAKDYKQAIYDDNAQKVLAALAVKANSADKILYLSESGRINQLLNKIDASISDFGLAILAYEKIDNKAIFSSSEAGALGASMLTNDNAFPYKGYSFERILLHQFQAFNYLEKNDIEGTSVELRRAAAEKQIEEENHASEIVKVKKKVKNENIIIPELMHLPEFTGMDILSGNVKSSFQNAYVFYTSAVIWEAQGEMNAALVDYKKSLEININNTSIQYDVKRVDAGMRLSADESALIILYEDGFIPERRSFRLDVPYLHHIFSIAFPYYSSSDWYKPQLINVRIGNKNYGETQVIANFGKMAVKALKEDVFKILVRQILRAKSKYELQQKVNEQNSLFAVVMNIYNVVSEQADVRNWLTLPNNAQAKRIVVKPGKHQIILGLNGMIQSVDLDLKSARTTILRVFNINNRLITKQYYL